MKKKVLVVDLDGTLFKINTFHYFLMFLLKYCIKDLNLFLLLKIIFIIIARVFKVVSHSKMKYNILKTIKNEERIDYSEYITSISQKKRDLSLISDGNFNLKILATAAPSCYANIISENECFDLCIATEFPNSKFNNEFDNIGEIKKNNTAKFLKNNKIDTLITDHIDDLPLMKLSRKNFIVNPNQKMKEILKEHNINYEVIF
ncbi:MAG: hypothetical protein HKO81_08000 [Flavobacteriaceae bacterium]|nr:hypothetical protein [Flavobacteriaceae bacterium]